jgi:hypothetical protein
MGTSVSPWAEAEEAEAGKKGKGGKAGLGAGKDKGDKFSIKNMEAQRDRRADAELGAIHKKLKAGMILTACPNRHLSVFEVFNRGANRPISIYRLGEMPIESCGATKR